MGKIEKGPEDKPEWIHPSNQAKQPKPTVCHSCKEVIVGAHCSESGCPWCAKCGRKLEK